MSTSYGALIDPSEGAEALRLGRRSVAVELKRSYWETGCRNLRAAVAEREQGTLDMGGVA